MSDFHLRFITHLRDIAEHDRGALAALRRSLAFAPGTCAAAMPHVEPWAVKDGTREPQRQALYLTAGLFAANSRHHAGTSLAAALAQVWLRRDSPSIERRFIALLSADAEALPVHLRHAVSLLAAEELGCDYAALAEDLGRWLDPWQDEARDRVRQRWARDFYRTLARTESTDDTPTQEATP
jgi:CRISPR system Cascade subunit CasB